MGFAKVVVAEAIVGATLAGTDEVGSVDAAGTTTDGADAAPDEVPAGEDGAAVAAGEVEPEPPCDELPAPPPLDESADGTAHETLIAFAAGIAIGLSDVAGDGIITGSLVVVDGLAAPFAPGVMDAGIGIQAVSAGSAGGRWGDAWATPASARPTIIAAGTPIPAIMIPSDSVIKLRCSIASREWIRRANWARRRSVRVGRLMADPSTHGGRDGPKGRGRAATRRGLAW